ncbi:MAG TPA: PPOX class F420-dependent oxidoreductase [Jatrophihabitans sp.]|jgi:PPOX class probable F420-dependent enzyme|uniref:PPOX class F420-dependent oxidoreductase n=1 Tax=Jatrophihabitans sp. TaxID=1932789 RepID=UPI002F086CF6
MAATEGPDALVRLITVRHKAVLATIKSDGRPQLSNVTYAFTADPSAPGAGVARISITSSRAKYRNLVRDPRASLHVSSPDFWSYAVAEALAELSPVAADPQDQTVDDLVALYRDVQGEHPDWQEFRQEMVTDQRVMLRLAVSRVYGMTSGG